MNTSRKLAAYGLVLAAALGGGAALGAAVGPIDVGRAPAHDRPQHHAPVTRTEDHQR